MRNIVKEFRIIGVTGPIYNDEKQDIQDGRQIKGICLNYLGILPPAGSSKSS
jgi:hypothetical protein